MTLHSSLSNINAQETRYYIILLFYVSFLGLCNRLLISRQKWLLKRLTLQETRWCISYHFFTKANNWHSRYLNDAWLTMRVHFMVLERMANWLHSLYINLPAVTPRPMLYVNWQQLGLRFSGLYFPGKCLLSYRLPLWWLADAVMAKFTFLAVGQQRKQRGLWPWSQRAYLLYISVTLLLSILLSYNIFNKHTNGMIIVGSWPTLGQYIRLLL